MTTGTLGKHLQYSWPENSTSQGPLADAIATIFGCGDPLEGIPGFDLLLETDNTPRISPPLEENSVPESHSWGLPIPLTFSSHSSVAVAGAGALATPQQYPNCPRQPSGVIYKDLPHSNSWDSSGSSGSSWSTVEDQHPPPFPSSVSLGGEQPQQGRASQMAIISAPAASTAVPTHSFVNDASRAITVAARGDGWGWQKYSRIKYVTGEHRFRSYLHCSKRKGPYGCPARKQVDLEAVALGGGELAPGRVVDVRYVRREGTRLVVVPEHLSSQLHNHSKRCVVRFMVARGS